MRFTARPSSRSRDTPGCECWGAGVGGGQPAACLAARAQLSAPQGILCSRLELPQPPHRLPAAVHHAAALRDPVSAGRGQQSRCLWEGLPGGSRRQRGEGFEDAADHSLVLSAELARSSQKHLQQTVKYGGRQRLPPPGEMKAFLVLGVQAAGILGLPWGVLGGARAFVWGGLTCHVPWQKGKMLRLLLVHLPGGVGYKTNIGPFTVSWGHPRRAGLGRGGAVGLSPGPAPSWPVRTPRWQQRCWRSCVGRWASWSPRRSRNLPCSSSKAKASVGGRMPGCTQGGSPAGSTFEPPPSEAVPTLGLAGVGPGQQGGR